MRQRVTYVWWILLILALFQAYAIADSLIREFSANLTYIDLGSLVILGVLAGFALGQILPLGAGRGRT